MHSYYFLDTGESNISPLTTLNCNEIKCHTSINSCLTVKVVCKDWCPINPQQTMFLISFFRNMFPANLVEATFKQVSVWISVCFVTLLSLKVVRYCLPGKMLWMPCFFSPCFVPIFSWFLDLFDPQRLLWCLSILEVSEGIIPSTHLTSAYQLRGQKSVTSML